MDDVAAPESTGTGTKPVKVFRAGRLSVTVFMNIAKVRDRDVAFFNSYLQRRYKEGEEFKTTHSLGKDDLLAGQQLLGQAWQWVVSEEAKRKTKSAA